MIESHQLEDIAAHNESSLKALVRAIALSQGKFRLILARCNYAALRDRMVQRLRELSPVKIRELILPESVKTLYTTITAELGGEVPQALMVFGLESALDLKAVLTSSNYIREEFSKHFPFPLVLWINDEVLRKLLRLAPDLESWATSVEFKLATDELLEFLRQKTDEIFAGDSTPNLANCFEIEAAWEGLQRWGQELEPDLEASLEFVRGLDDFANDEIDAALEHFHKSLAFWQQGEHLYQISLITYNIERQGRLLLYIALCYYRKAERHRAESLHCWERARDYLQQCLDVFEQAQRSDLVAKHISKLGEVLRRLQAWEQLQALAEKGLTLHQTYNDSRQLARDYGFLAEVALEQLRWNEANQLARQALQTLTKIPDVQPYERGLYQFLLARSQEYLGQRQEAIANFEQARQESNPQYNPELCIDILGELRELYFQQGEYLKAFEIKRERRLIEYQYGFQAFAGASLLAPKQQVIHPALVQASQQASVAREIAASGRERDVERLIERIRRNDYRLIVIHGQSGVGKSSILSAGLVPALKQQAIDARNALPVGVRVYTHWVRELGRALAEGLEEVRGVKLPEPLDFVEAISEQLRKNAERNLLTVLIFDQFEEFFFVCPDKTKRRVFFEFLRDCLNIGFVKVILSLRRDYLHYLLESEQAIDLDAINNNILDKNIRYPLGNFSPEEAKAVIQSLTERSQFYLQPELIDELVRDLAGKFGEVRPIELQVVGAQLQADTITTLVEYEDYGSKEKLVEKYLEAVIKDCGAENERAAQLVLYFLTNEKNTRPLKTRAELVVDLEAADFASEVEKLDVVLQILVGSGLVLKIPEAPFERYQLVHDYLVSVIRQLEQVRQLEERKKEKEKRQQAEAELNQVLERQRNKAKRQRNIASIVGFAMTILAGLSGVFWLQADSQRKEVEKRQIYAISKTSEALFASNQRFDALKESIRAGIKLKQASFAQIDPEIRAQVKTALQQPVYWLVERNRLEGHEGLIWGVTFSPDGETIASASYDHTIKLWNRNGKEQQTLNDHSDKVLGLTFSPDGKTIASGDFAGVVKFWKRDNNGKFTCDKSLTEHTKGVYSVDFSPDGQIVATASRDNTVKLWKPDGTLLETLKGHKDGVNSVAFSPDGKTIATGSRDKTVKLWTRDGTLITTLTGNEDFVWDVAWSPDSKTIATAGRDNTVKLWKQDGNGKFEATPYTTFPKGHSDGVNRVAFSPDGKMIASVSDDETVKLWKLDGTLLTTLLGHSNGVYAVSFSPGGETLVSASADSTMKLWQIGAKSFSRNGKTLTSTSADSTIKLGQLGSGVLSILYSHSNKVKKVSFSPDGKIIATASLDQTVKFWKPDGTFKTLNGHKLGVRSVSFSPDGQTIATASDDKSVKLWKQDGSLIRTLTGDWDKILDVSFSPDGQTLALGSMDNTVILLRRNGKDEFTLYKTLKDHKDWVRAVAWSPDSKIIASASDDNTVKLWQRDGKSGLSPYKTLTGDKGHKSWVLSVSFSPDGKMIATASNDKTVKLWNRDGSLIKTIEGYSDKFKEGHRDQINSVSFSPNGEMIATASDDKTVKLWNRDGTWIRTLSGHSVQILSVTFSADGKTLALGSADGATIQWDLDELNKLDNLDKLLERGCSQVRDYLKTNRNVSESDRTLCDDILTQK